MDIDEKPLQNSLNFDSKDSKESKESKDRKEKKVNIEPSPMTGVQTYHPEWAELSLSDDNFMEDSDENITDSVYNSPGLFIEAVGLGERLLLKRNGNIHVDLIKLETYFKFGHAWYAPWEKKRGIHIRFASMDLLKRPYQFCIDAVNKEEINFCMLRGKLPFGAVPPSEHPGKIVVKQVYGTSMSEVQTLIRAALFKIKSL